MFVRTSTRLSLAAAIICVPLLAAAAHGDRFANGESFYGQPGISAANARIVDVTTAKFLNVDYGDTVVFSNGGKQFAWTFDGLGRRAVKLEKIAPHDFGATAFIVYIDVDPLQRN